VEIHELRHALAALKLGSLRAALESGTAATEQRPRMSVDEANARAMQLAKQMGQAFFLLSERRQAEQIGCHWKTWTSTPFYSQAQKRKASLTRRASAGKAAGSPPVASFTRDLEAATGEGDRNEVLNNVMFREDAEADASARQQELERLIAEHRADAEPSPCEDDPLGRPKKVRARKRL
jgi:hypothetical protein